MSYEKKLISKMNVLVKTGDIKIDDHIIHYIEAGSGYPVVLLHGVNIGAGQWYKNIEELSKKFKVYAIDLPGAGKSSSVDFRSIDLDRDFIGVVLKFIKIKGIIKPHIIGHSVGGWIALKIAALRGKFIGKVVAVSPAGMTNYIPLNYRLIALYPFVNLIINTVMRPTKANIKKFLCGPFKNKDVVEEDFVDYFYQSVKSDKRRHPLLLINKLSYFYKINNGLSLLKILGYIDNEVMIMVGQHDKLVNYDRILIGIKMIKNCNVKIMKDVGHVVLLEDSAVFNEEVINFLYK